MRAFKEIPFKANISAGWDLSRNIMPEGRRQKKATGNRQQRFSALPFEY
jgi:hypothetical protein